MVSRSGSGMILAAALAAVSMFPLACASRQVTYGDPGAVETVTIGFGSTDLQQIATKMVQSLLVHPAINRPQGAPVVLVGPFRNRTSEHIDTKSVTDKIRTELIKSGKVRFPARSEAMDQRMAEQELQNKGYTDPSTAKRLGKMINVDYILEGDLSSINKHGDGVQDLYYKVTLNLVDIETDEIVWTDEKEIRKTAERSIFGK